MSLQRSFTTVLAGGTFFESPRWHDGRWYVTDIYRHAVVTFDADGGDVRDAVSLPVKPSATGWLPDGAMVVVAADERALLRVEDDGAVTTFADLSAHLVGMANELVVDEHGRAYVGDVGFDVATFDLTSGQAPRTAHLVRVDPDGSVHPVADDLLMPNGMAITPDGRTLLVGESLGTRYSAFTIADDGSLDDRRTWATFPMGTAPDGCVLDADGRLWFADAFGGRCLLAGEGGEVVEELRMPDGLQVYACMLGGHDGRTLMLCCAPDFFPEARAAAREAVLMSTEVDVPLAGRP